MTNLSTSLISSRVSNERRTRVLCRVVACDKCRKQTNSTNGQMSNNNSNSKVFFSIILRLLLMRRLVFLFCLPSLLFWRVHLSETLELFYIQQTIFPEAFDRFVCYEFVVAISFTRHL